MTCSTPHRLLFLAAALTLAVSACASEPAADIPATPEQGRAVADDRGCLSCHTTDGSRRVGPTWQGLWGSQVELADGIILTADEAYIRRSITDPGAQHVAGYGTMPNMRVSNPQVDALVAYIRSLDPP